MFGVDPPPMFKLPYPDDMKLLNVSVVRRGIQLLLALFMRTHPASFRSPQLQVFRRLKMGDEMAFFVVTYYEHNVLRLFEEEFLWEKIRDEDNNFYYHNKATGESTREKPNNMNALLKDHIEGAGA
jgi:hypothetical protein